MVRIDGRAYIDAKEVADLLDVAPETVRNWRSVRRDNRPTGERIGVAVLYPLNEVEAFAATYVNERRQG